MKRWRKDALEGCCAQRYIARQPILDRHGRTFAYELLFRSAPEDAFHGESEQATRTTIDNLLLYGLQKLTDGKTAFVNCTLQALNDGLVELLPPRVTVFEVLETIEPSPELAATCMHLKSRGYRIALDDFRWVPGIESLVELADYIKVDFLQSDKDERTDILRRLRGSSAVLLAEKVETQEVFEHALREGFTLFQGYYFCHPQLMTHQDIPANAEAQLELLRNLQQKNLNFQSISKVVERDPAISYRILRLANSAAVGARGEINSVEKALIVLGEDRFRHIAALTIATALSSGRPAEVLRLALARARFCELGAGLTGCDATEQYLLGLFSLLPAMLQISMEDALATIAFRTEIRNALMGECNADSCLLRWIESYSHGHWSSCDLIANELQIDPDPLQQCAMDAMNWADKMLHSVL